MADIKFGLSEFAAYMAAGAGSRRTQLTAKKFPKDEDKIPGKYYAPVVKLIREYHEGGHQPEWLESKAQVHDGKAAALLTNAPDADAAKAKYKADQHQNFARVLRSYRSHFAKKRFQVRTQIDIPYTIDNVRVSIRPDLHVVQGQTEKIIKFWCKDDQAKNRPKPLEIRVITQVMLDSANAHGHMMSGSQVLLFDVQTGQVHKGAKLGAQLGKDIVAECQAMEAVWQTLKQR
ncbi:hypothetical protein GC173_10515 [bacterium]|nr:hypothetical protein [bacterium]